MAKKEGSPFVVIGASLGGILLAIIALFLVFAKEMVEYTISIAWAFVVLGVGVAFFQYLAMRQPKKKK